MVFEDTAVCVNPPFNYPDYCNVSTPPYKGGVQSLRG